MQWWLDFLQNELPSDDARQILPINRQRKIDFEWKPENEEEFHLVIKKAPVEILKGFGFLPYSELPEGPYRQNQKEVIALLGKDCELFLFPSEWYDIIPSGFSVINIFGEVLPFGPGKTDSSVRLGCLSFGISVSIP